MCALLYISGPPPPVGSPNPAYPPGYTSTYPSAPPYPAYPAAPQHPTYPAAPAPGAFSHPGQYPAGMYPAAMGPTAPPGAMPYPAPGLHPYPVTPCGYPVVPPPCVYGPYPHSPKWGHHKSHHKVHHHGAVNPMSGALVAMGMGLVGHKANKKMMKKMKKAHKKQRKMNNCGKV